MAVSRGKVVLLSMGALCVLFAFLIASIEASIEEDSEIAHIHAVNRAACNGGLDSEKGNQCQDDDDDDSDDDDDVDDDVDDTYKVVNDVKVTLSKHGHAKVKVPEVVDDDVDDDAPETDPEQFDVLGH